MSKAEARLNHARWIADCPNCSGAELAKPGEVIACHSCGVPYGVKWPRHKETIDLIVKMRPIVNQNWEPGESLATLRQENEDNDIQDLSR